MVGFLLALPTGVTAVCGCPLQSSLERKIPVQDYFYLAKSYPQRARTPQPSKLGFKLSEPVLGSWAARSRQQLVLLEE